MTTRSLEYGQWVRLKLGRINCPPGIGAVVAAGKRMFSIWATTPALRATPPVPGGEPEFETDPLPEYDMNYRSNSVIAIRED